MHKPALAPANEGLARLTAEEFRELDVLARTKVGCALEVKKHEDMGSSVARMNYMVGCGYGDAENTEGAGCMMDLSIIQVANQIDLNEIGTWQRPELNYGAIPACDVFRFAVLHEIGHHLGDYDWLEALRLSRKEQSWVRTLNEAKADRFAWKSLYGGKRMPKNVKAIASRSQLAYWQKKVEQTLAPQEWKHIPLTTEVGKCVPASHVRNGIPLIG